MEASYDGLADIVMTLVEEGADVNYTDKVLHCNFENDMYNCENSWTELLPETENNVWGKGNDHF